MFVKWNRPTNQRSLQSHLELSTLTNLVQLNKYEGDIAIARSHLSCINTYYINYIFVVTQHRKGTIATDNLPN